MELTNEKDCAVVHSGIASRRLCGQRCRTRYRFDVATGGNVIGSPCRDNLADSTCHVLRQVLERRQDTWVDRSFRRSHPGVKPGVGANHGGCVRWACSIDQQPATCRAVRCHAAGDRRRCAGPNHVRWIWKGGECEGSSIPEHLADQRGTRSSMGMDCHASHQKRKTQLAGGRAGVRFPDGEVNDRAL
jgi:predicted CxxxxCH...CXXCH cytochrome family protein